jgi:hypothetical protein
MTWRYIVWATDSIIEEEEKKKEREAVLHDVAHTILIDVLCALLSSVGGGL